MTGISRSISSGRRQKITWHNPPRRAKQITNPQHGPALSAFARGYCCVVVGAGVLAAEMCIRDSHAGLHARLEAAAQNRVRRARERLLPLVRTLNAVSPLATLDRGYAIVTKPNGEILRDAADAPPGTLVEARLAKGRIRAKVEGRSE